jgi:hypothetical protein
LLNHNIHSPQNSIQTIIITNDHHEPQTAVWDRHGYENRMSDDNWQQNNQYTTTATANNTWDPVAAITSAWGDEPPTAATVATTNSWNDAPSHNTSSGPKTRSSTVRTQQKSQPQVPPAPKKDGFSLFLQEHNMPTWDD